MTDVHAANALDHPHDHDHSDDHDHHDHGHKHQAWWAKIAEALHLPGFSHVHERPATGDALYSHELGIRTVQIAFAILAVTTVIQIAIYLASGSVALLADTVHNLGDALNSLPLWLAFVLMRRAANKRYTYGYGRAEDLAGLLIVVSIVFSAGYILWESFQKLLNPEPLTQLGWVGLAAVVGFIGNETVAAIQIRTGKKIGSEALVADGLHARIDGFTSLAVLIAVAGTWLGFPITDPIVGLLIGVAIVFIAKDAAVSMWHRMMDAVDPALVETVEGVLAGHTEIREVKQLQMRWIGHRLNANLIVALDEGLDLIASGQITDHIRHHLLHDIPHLDDVVIAAVPYQKEAADESMHHRAT